MIEKFEGRTNHELTSYQASLEEQRFIADYLREKSWEVVAHVQTGHLGGPSSSAELLTALYFGGHLKIDLNNNMSDDRDRVIIRGHLAPLRYSLFNLLGWVEDEELKHYRQLGSRLHGHEKMGSVPGVDITPAGALGMVLSYGCGSAIDAKNRERDYSTFVFLGDGEEQEGNISEAARHAAAMRLNNMVCIIDRNEKQLSRPTQDVDVSDLLQVWEGYGWEVFEIEDGHNLEEINIVYDQAIKSESDKPRVIVATTVKGKGLPEATENCCGYHTINAFGGQKLKEFVVSREIPHENSIKPLVSRIMIETYGEESQEIRTHNPVDFYKQPEQYSESLGEELGRLFKHCATLMDKGYPVYVITADMMPVDETKGYGLEGKKNFIDVGIREQHMLAMAHAISVTNPEARIFIKSHDAFIYRAADQIQAINLGGSRVILVGDYGGLSGNFNGETHESTGQPGMMIMMGSAQVFEPADAHDFWNVTNYVLVENPGLVYMRLYSREACLLPKLDENMWFYRTFEPKKSPELILVSCGLTAADTYLAGEQLEKEGVPTRVINVVGLNATQSEEFTKLFREDVPVLSVYNGHPFVLESLVSTALMRYSKIRPSHLEGHGFAKGKTGSMPDLKIYFGLDHSGIMKKAKELL